MWMSCLDVVPDVFLHVRLGTLGTGRFAATHFVYLLERSRCERWLSYTVLYGRRLCGRFISLYHRLHLTLGKPERFYPTRQMLPAACSNSVAPASRPVRTSLIISTHRICLLQSSERLVDTRWKYSATDEAALLKSTGKLVTIAIGFLKQQ